jgi:RNA polymerase sigma-70 factor, ECF subfamily
VDNIEESLLIMNLRQGNEHAFKTIYERYYVILYNYAVQILENETPASEIVDDAIFYIWEHRKEVIIHHLLPYLLRSVRNGCINYLQSQHYRMENQKSVYISNSNMMLIETLFNEKYQPIDELIKKEFEEKLEYYIEQLPEECRAVFKKSRFEQKKYEEIAEELHISKNTVKYHIKNALAFLHEHLKDYIDFFFLLVIENFFIG